MDARVGSRSVEGWLGSVELVYVRMLRQREAGRMPFPGLDETMWTD